MAVTEKAFDIVGIGVSTLDVLTIVDSFPHSSGVQKGHGCLLQGGGPVSTALVAASKLGAKTAMVDNLGDDWIGQRIIDEFISYGVDTELITVLPNETSSLASILVRKSDGERAIMFNPGSASELPVNVDIERIIKQSKCIHINGRHLNFCIKACKAAKENKVIISFDGGSGRYRSELDELMNYVDYCVIAKDFCDQWLGEMDIARALHTIINNGCALAVITMGAKGSAALEKGSQEIQFQKAFNFENIVDTTGCGDIFHGAFLYSILNNYSVSEGLKIASAASAIKATKLGGRGIVPGMGQIRELIDE